jgi:hypothetical protein
MNEQHSSPSVGSEDGLLSMEALHSIRATPRTTNDRQMREDQPRDAPLPFDGAAQYNQAA